MGKKISQYPELTTLTGNELTILAYRGNNYTTKLSTLIALATGTENSFAQIEAQVNINKLAIQSLNDTISNIAVNLNNTMGQVNTAVSTVNSMSSSVSQILSKMTTDEAQIAQLVSDVTRINQAVLNLELGEQGEIQQSLVFDQADW